MPEGVCGRGLAEGDSDRLGVPGRPAPSVEALPALARREAGPARRDARLAARLERTPHARSKWAFICVPGARVVRVCIAGRSGCGACWSVYAATGRAAAALSRARYSRGTAPGQTGGPEDRAFPSPPPPLFSLVLRAEDRAFPSSLRKLGRPLALE